MARLINFFTATAVTLFVMLAFHAFWYNINTSWIKDFSELFPWFFTIMLFSTIYAITVYKVKYSLHLHCIALGFIIITIILRGIWVSYFDAEQISDFGTYWNVGKSIVENGIAEQSVRPVYIRRALFYTAPIHYLFGNSLRALELVNVALVSFAMLLFYEYGRRAYNAKAAALSLLFFLWNPDIWYGVKLATHDIAFLPWFAGLCLMMYWLNNKFSNNKLFTIPTLSLSFALGLFVFIIDIQRGWGRPVWFAFILLLFYLIYEEYQSKNREITISRFSFVGLQGWFMKSVIYLLFIIVIPFSVNQASNALLDYLTDSEQNASLSVDATNVSMSYYAAKNIYGSDTWGQRRYWRETYSLLIPEQVVTEYSVRKLTHEIVSEPSETVRHISRKNAVLSNPTGTLNFSSRPSDDPEVGRTNSSNVPMQRSLNFILASLIFFALFLRLLLYPFFSVRREQLFLIFYTAFFYLFILLLTESQPRYNVFTVFLVSLLVAQLILKILNMVFKGSIEVIDEGKR